MKNYKTINLIFILFSTLLPLFSFADQVNIGQLQTFSGAVSATSSSALNGVDLTTYIFGFYEFALIIAGVLAMGAIVYGAILYTISSGNTSRQAEAKEWITQAFLGLLLLLAANLLLGTINKNILSPNVNVEKIKSITPIAPTSTAKNAVGYCNSCTAATAGQSCFDNVAYSTCPETSPQPSSQTTAPEQNPTTPGQNPSLPCSACSSFTPSSPCYDTVHKQASSCP